MSGKDRQVKKTKKLIQDALLSLMFEKQYSKITIQDIIDRADVGRSTFYSHFTDKEDLLFSSIEFLIDMVNNFVISHVEQIAEDESKFTTVDFFQHLQEHNRLFIGLLKSESSNLFFDKIQASAEQKIGQYFTAKIDNSKNIKIPLDILINHISGALINMVKWWMKNSMCYTPLQMDGYYRMLINPCIDFIMN